MSDPLAAIRYRLPASGCWLSADGCWLLAFGFRRKTDSRQRIADSGKLIKECTYDESSCNRSDRSAWL